MTDNQKKLLIVDDDVIYSETLARVMQRQGFNCITANDSANAAIRAKKNNPELALIDLRIDKESGLQLTQDLLKILPDLQIVILTGFASIATAVEAIKLGAIHYLTKPATPEQIKAAFQNSEGNTKEAAPEHPLSVERLEWEHIQKVLNENDGNISAAARSLGMHRRTLQRKLNKHPRQR